MSNRLLYILDYYLPHKGGVETVFEQIISRSLARGCSVTVLTAHYDASLPKEEKIGNLHIVRTGSTRKNFLRSCMSTGFSLLRKERFDLIHTSTYGGAIPAWILGRFFGIKTIITVHEIFDKLWKRYKPRYSAWLFQIFEALIFSLPYDAYHCVSLYTLNALRLSYGIADQKLSLIYNGVDRDFRDSNKVKIKEKSEMIDRFSLSGHKNILYFGHTGISKGIDTLVEAIPAILERFPDAQLIFNFIPAKRGKLIEQKIQDFLSSFSPSQTSRVHIQKGLSKEDLRALVSSVDVVIAPSLSEGFGSVHTETLALETPLITTEVSAIPEVVGGKVVLIPPQDENALIAAIERVFVQEFDQREAKNFDWELQYEKIWKLYQRFGVRSSSDEKGLHGNEIGKV